MGVIEFLLALAQDMILAAIPAVGFAMVFNVPVRALRWCALLGAIGHGSRMILMTSGLNIEWSTFMASMLVGTIGIQWSRWYLAHPKVFTVAAVIPMFPGISAYTAIALSTARQRLAGDTRQLREGEGRNQPEKDRCDRQQTTHQDLPLRLSKFFITD